MPPPHRTPFNKADKVIPDSLPPKATPAEPDNLQPNVNGLRND